MCSWLLLFSLCFLLFSGPLSSKPLPQEEGATTFNPDSLVLSFEDLVAINDAENNDDEDTEDTTTALELLLKYEGML